MIYSTNNEPLVLIEDAADSFLESVGVRLFEDEISINGVMYEGSYGESILEENGIFLYEDGIVLEGEQAEEYKARKAKEKADAEEAESNRNKRRYSKNSGYGMFHKSKQDDFDRKIASAKIYDKEATKRAEDKINAKLKLDSIKARSNAFKKKMSELGPSPTGNKSSDIQKRKDWTRKYVAYRDEADKLDRYYLPMNRKDVEKAELSYNRIKDNKHSAQDAINRHMRRHPKQYGKKPSVQHNSTIFSDIEII